MTLSRPFIAALALVALAFPLRAADFSDPTWPCIQRKVETLSPGLMWPYPIEPGAAAADNLANAEIDALAEALSLRRVPLDTLRPQLAAFAATNEGDPALLGLVFARVFDGLSKRRTRIIGGIADFSLSQIALSETIGANRAEMDQLIASDAPDYDRVDALEERIDWDTVIYSDRQRSITYLCETPRIIEQRLFSIARLLQEFVREPG